MRYVSTESLKEIRTDHLFGGLADLIETRDDFSEVLDHLKVSALLFESMIIQDSWFFCEGPIVRHLRTLGDDDERWRRDEFVRLVSVGIVRPALRTGNSLLDVWRGGSEVGVTPGHFLMMSKAEGDRLVERISSYANPTAHVPFPKPVVNDNKSLFGLSIEAYLEEGRLREVTDGDYFLVAQVPEAQTLVDSFRNFVANNMSADFRRGHVEQFIAKEVGLRTFSYRELTGLRNGTQRERVARALLQDVSTLYAGTQSQLFQVRPQAYCNHDSQLLERYLLGDWEKQTKNVMPNVVLDLKDALDVQALSVEDIVFVRSKLDDGRLFARLLELMKACAAQQGVDAFTELVAFIKASYVPAVIAQVPRTQVARYTKPLATGLHWIADVGNEFREAADKHGLLLGMMGVTMFAASTVGLFDVAHLCSSVRKYAEQYEVNAETLFSALCASYAATRAAEQVEDLGASAQARLDASLVRRAQRKAEAWEKRNNYLTAPAAK